MTFESEKIASDVQNLAVGNIVNLYEIDLTTIGQDGYLRFTESIDNDYTPISFGGDEFIPIHMKTDGWSVTSADTLPRPKIMISNVLLTYAAYINSFDSLIGAKFTRRRTLEKYLDGKPEENPSAEFAPDIYRIRTMPQKTKAVAEFELTPYMDFEGINIPKRQIIRDFCRQTYRIWSLDSTSFNYTNTTCPYTHDYCYTRLGDYTTDESQDDCGKSLSDCEMRYAGVAASDSKYDVFIQDTEPVGAGPHDYWLNTLDTPNVWYTYSPDFEGNYRWVASRPDPLPTYAFPSVSRFRV